jgi:hypothetical protein
MYVETRGHEGVLYTSSVGVITNSKYSLCLRYLDFFLYLSDLIAHDNCMHKFKSKDALDLLSLKHMFTHNMYTQIAKNCNSH